MKLENVDVKKLQLGDLPKFDKCPCELCDDGCFDRAGNKHHPECQRKQLKRTKLSLATRCPLSHYQGTFVAATSASGRPADYRRHPCPPAPDNDILPSFRNVPMTDTSSQKIDYQPPPPGTLKQQPVKPDKKKDNLSLARETPMETQTHYQAEYVEKPVISNSLRSSKDSVKTSQINITEPSAPIESQTTSRAHFKSWQSAPSQAYAEMPPVAGHVLFPGTNRTFDTTSGSNFIPFPNTSLTKPIVRLDHNGSWKISGSMDLRTNYRQDYIAPELPSKQNTPKGPKERSIEQNVYTRRPMNEISQTSYDFRPYSKHRPTPAAMMEPFQSQITMGNSFTSVEKESQYQLDYPGYDTNKHPRQPLAAPKDHQKPYVAPIYKMDTQTVTQRDYPPIDITTLPRIRTIPAKPTLSVNDQQGPMESVTMSRYHYQPYESPPSNRRYGELVSNVYIPPMDKFQGTTTTGETYQGRSGQPARAFIPEVAMVNRGGAHDHNTNYRIDYPPYGLSLCAAKAYTIAQNKQTTTAPVSAQ